MGVKRNAVGAAFRSHLICLVRHSLGKGRTTMNRYAKGAIAAGAATVLLLGGLGTFALWNDSQSIDAGTVGSGRLALDTTGMDGNWYLYVAGDDDPGDYDPQDAIDIDTYTVVPGDELIFVATGIELDAEGGELYFTVSTTLAGADSDGFTVTDPELFGDDGLGGSTPATDGEFAGVDEDTPVYSIVAADGVLTEEFDATVRVSFDADDTDYQNADLDLSDAAIEVQQVVKA
jgi:alternate signal-mediated exported protein